MGKANDKAKAATKTEIVSAVADKTGLTKKQVNEVLEALAGQVKKDLGKRGPGIFTIPGLVKLKVLRKPATKSREMKNPFTGEMITVKAKPARNVVKASPLKAVKDMV
jgi:nucleoid DNA-binding protein